MEPSSFSGSSKRAKAPGNIAQVAHCLVDGCDADLSLCRDYHRRHKVCEIHSKTPKVTIGGREQRFCQQCSRFHSLVEFDEGKRSCRKRLDGHNRRRRKPQPDALARNSGLVFSTHQTATGTRLVSFSNPQMLPTDVMGSSWPGNVKPEHDIPLYNNQHLNYIDRPNAFPESSSQGVTHLQFVPEGNITATHQSLLDPNSVSGRSSDCALSLLSSTPPTITREFRLNHMVQTDAPLPPTTQPLAHNIHFGGGLGRYSPVHESKPFVPATGNNSSASTLHFPEMFQQQLPPGDGSSSTSGPHQTLTFMWE